MELLTNLIGLFLYGTFEMLCYILVLGLAIGAVALFMLLVSGCVE